MLYMLLIGFALVINLCLAWQVYLRKEYLSSNSKFVATEEDRKNPDYSDPCVVEVGIICNYCCIISKGECSNDIRACDPIIPEERNFLFFYIMVGTMICVICGCPLAAKVLEYTINSRCLAVTI